MTIQTTACDLHVPHKEWSDDEKERQNYLEIERWAKNFHDNCLPSASGVTIHRSMFYGGVNIPNNTSGFNIDFTALSTDPTFHMGTAITPVSSGGVHMTKAGLFSWAGGLFFSSFGSTGYSEVDWFTWTYNSNGNIRSPLPNDVSMGGSIYLDANDYFYMPIKQTSGATHSMQISMTFTLLEFA